MSLTEPVNATRSLSKAQHDRKLSSMSAAKGPLFTRSSLALSVEGRLATRHFFHGTRNTDHGTPVAQLQPSLAAEDRRSLPGSSR